MYKIKEFFENKQVKTSFLSALALSPRTIFIVSAIRLHVYVIEAIELLKR